MKSCLQCRWLFQSLLAVLVGVASLTAFAQPTEAGSDCQKGEVHSLGQVTSTIHRHDLVFLEDDLQASRLAGILGRIAGPQANDGRYRIVVVNDPDIASFSSPDGTVYLTSGLVFAATDTGVAQVVAHEMAHIDGCHHYLDFSGTYSRRMAINIGSGLLAAVLIVATAGAAAAAMGPMATATASSTAIISAGSSLATSALMVPQGLDKVTIVKPELARADIEGSQGSAYGAGLIGSIVKAKYFGFDEATERQANQQAAVRLKAAGISGLPADPSDFFDSPTAELASGHLHAVVKIAQGKK